MRRAIILAVVVAACGHPAPPASLTAVPGAAPARVTSNILRADYAGSPACGDCHAQIYASWQTSPMRNMTRDAATATIRAPFDGATLHVGSDVATMTQHDGARFVDLVHAGATATWRVTKVIGGRYREDFAGVDVTGAADPLHATGNGIEHILPATYVFSTKSWRYKGYSVMVTERPAMSTSAVWRSDCIPCHNTLPYVTMLYDPLYGAGLPAYQGKAADGVLPAGKTWSVAARDEDGLTRALTAEVEYFGARAPEQPTLRTVLPAAAIATARGLDGKHVVELGVGCEACHNGSREHAAEPTTKPAFATASALVTVTPPHGETGTDAQQINHICARCHTVLFTHYPWTWEGGKRKDRNPGGSSISSGEGRDYQLGGCASAMACTTCHDPHVADSPEKLRALGTPAGNKLCLTCHPQFAAAGAVEAHSHHATGSAGTACIACHMAKKNMGLDYGLNRYHRIGSPTDARRVLGDRPLECALCHQDKTVASLVTSMETWWGKHYDRGALAAMYGGSLDVNAIRATLALGKEHEQATAIAVLGDARAQDAVPLIVPMLAHPYPLVRYFAQRALQTITGDPVAIDVGAPAADVTRAGEVWLRAWMARTRP